jgi:hypothetical protein
MVNREGEFLFAVVLVGAAAPNRLCQMMDGKPIVCQREVGYGHWKHI